MALWQIPDRGTDPQSTANPALAQVILEALIMPNGKAEEGRLRVVRDERPEEVDDDPMGPARGIVNGLRLSVTLWSFIALVVLLTR
jgi:molybdopterin-guanine dinucleotide biosynthesis protein A